jgi:transcription initiation factor TFIIB
LNNPTYEQEKGTTCIECGGTQIIQDNETGEQVCLTCGIVFSSIHLDTSPEWRAYNNIEQENRPRVGAPITWTIHDKGLSTEIDWHGKDAAGRRLSPETRAQLFRLRKWHIRSKVSDSRNRNLSHALTEISVIQSKLNLPKNVVETSSFIYRQALNANLIRGRSIASIAAACVYMACRQCSIIRSLEDLADASSVSKNEVARNYRFLIKILNPKVPQVEPEGYIGKIVGKLSLGGDTERLAKLILREASLMKLTSGRGPAGLAAASVYLSSKIIGDVRIQSDIAEVAQVTEVTVRNRYKELFQKLRLEIYL